MTKVLKADIEPGTIIEPDIEGYAISGGIKSARFELVDDIIVMTLDLDAVEFEEGEELFLTVGCFAPGENNGEYFSGHEVSMGRFDIDGTPHEVVAEYVTANDIDTIQMRDSHR